MNAVQIVRFIRFGNSNMKLINVASAIIFATVLMFAPQNQQANAQCLADVNHDNYVDGTDLTAILSTWGSNGAPVGGDINGDGTVNGLDLAFVLSGWGVCPGPTWATVLEWTPNPAVVTNVTMRNAITASGLPWRVRDHSSNIEMMLVPAGTFLMGCSASVLFPCASIESPTHQVTLTNAFYMGKTEVTQAQWLAVMGTTPSYFVGNPNNPVERVNWNMIQDFNTATGLRLPTEAEWEYAYRAGTTTGFHSYPAQPTGFSDDTLLGNIAWYSSNSGSQTHAVGGKFANGLGLHDMAGNVWEWCQDRYGLYSSVSVTNPTGPTSGSNRLLRGGPWNGDSGNCRASGRLSYTPDIISFNFGFRVARTLEPTITSITPISGPTAGGTAITIVGTSLTGATSVTVGGVNVTNLVVVSSIKITAVTPAGTFGSKSVAVTTPAGTATVPNAFTYIAPVPTITSVSPLFGSTAGGTPITIMGTNLTSPTSVTVGGIPATSVVWSSTSITAVTPASTVGAKSVVVTTPGGTATATSQFTYATPTGWNIVLEQTPNPAVVTNVTMRNAIIALGLPWRVQDNGTGIEMLLVPAGTFIMGCSASLQDACFSDENPTHQVTLTQAFYMGRYEVTQAQWLAKIGSNPSSFVSENGYLGSFERPVENVSWDMIQPFCSQNGLRLPTEAEWEYAYRAGTTTAFHSYPAQPTGFNNDNLLGNIAWYDSNAGSQTHVVGGKYANALGLHDMSGNVWEWCQDWYSDTYYGSSPLTNPTGPATGSYRLLRGGGYWDYDSNRCRASRRYDGAPDVIGDYVGFRVLRTP